MSSYRLDEYGQVINNAANALSVRQELERGSGMVAFQWALGNGTSFSVVFVNLDPAKVTAVWAGHPGYAAGYVYLGIERVGGFSLPWYHYLDQTSDDYIVEKWNVPRGDAKEIRKFFGTVLTGQDMFAEASDA